MQEVLSGGDIFNGSIKALRRRLIFQQLDQELVEFKELKMQGTLIGLCNVDYLKSQDIFRNVKMADVLVVFWYKIRHNVLGCKYTLFIWYGSSPRCPLDNYRLAHLLNNCSEFKDVCSVRHDKIVNKLGQELESVSVNLFVNKCVSTSLEELNLPRNLLCLKPDIVIKHEKQINILEVSCPYDLYLQNTFETKKSKYATLKDAIESKGYVTLCLL